MSARQRGRGRGQRRERERELERERGSLAVEAAIVAPVLLGLFCLVLLAGRAELQAGSVEEAARVAARAGSLDRSGDVQGVADKAARDSLSGAGVRCSNLRVSVGVEPLTGPPVPLNVVVVNVSCEVPVNDLSPVWVPGELTLNGGFRSVIDRYRSS